MGLRDEKEVVDNNKQVEREEQTEVGIIAEFVAKVKSAVENWIDRKVEAQQKVLWDVDKQNIADGIKNFENVEAQRETEDPIVQEAIDEIVKDNILESLKEIKETDEIDNQVILGELNKSDKVSKEIFTEPPKEAQGIRESLKKRRERNLLKKMDLAIREASRSANYFNLSNDSYQDAKFFAQEEKAIETVFAQNRKHLERYFNQEEIYQIKLKFQERAQLMDELRQEGLDFRVGKINRLKTLEAYFGVKSAEGIRFLDSLEIELKAKQRVRGLDKRIANEHQLDIKEDVVWGEQPLVRAGTGVHKERRKTLQEILSEAQKERRDSRTEEKLQQWRKRQEQKKEIEF